MIVSRTKINLLASIAASLLALACTDDSAAEQADDSEASGDTSLETETGDGDGDSGLETMSLTHRFGERELVAFQETEPCVQWTLDNDAPLYVQAVTLANLGYYHHSNWFVVPEDEFPGEDGYFGCGTREFSEFQAAMVGTVLFAQSTQSFVEEQRTLDGAVIKIPARHKVMADVHMLNVGPDTVTTDLFMTLDMIHPADVETVLTPFRLSYLDLDIPANSEARFTGFCDLAPPYENVAGHPLDMKIHYVLPHYHYLGNYFNFSVDGEDVYTLDGFNGEANGKVFDPPVDLTGAEEVSYTCGYDNWRDVNVGWGIGDQEMCVMLGLAESAVLIDVSVIAGTVAQGEVDGILQYQALCGVWALAKNETQGPPTPEEQAGPWNIPESGDPGIPPVPECVDHDPSVAPDIPPTLANVNAAVFEASCSFSSCHGSAGQAAGLNLRAPNLLAELLDHEVIGNPGMALVEPGDPDNSWLYQVMSSCAPDKGDGTIAAHMPLNAPILLGDSTVALVREWIASGAN